jgi:hypothetical protein
LRIPSDASIPRDKLTRYLLVYRDEDDKSQFLAQIGFTQDNLDWLETALRVHIEEYEAVEEKSNQYGVFYQVNGDLIGVERRKLLITSIWMREKSTGKFRFITLKKWRKKDDET